MDVVEARPDRVQILKRRSEEDPKIGITATKRLHWTPGPTIESDYVLDIVSHLVSREKEVPFEYMKRSPQLEQRRCLVDWVCLKAFDLQYNRTTINLGVRLLDLFMDRHKIKDTHLYPLALVSVVFVAGKLEMEERSVPKTSKLVKILNDYAKNEKPAMNIIFRRKDLVTLEKLLVQFFGWKLLLPTFTHFVELVLPVLCPEDSNWVFRDQFRAYVYFFTDIALQDENLVPCLQSAVAWSIFRCTELATNTWPPTTQNNIILHIIKGNTKTEDISFITQRLMDTFYESRALEL